jgi:hypothetical protein
MSTLFLTHRFVIAVRSYNVEERLFGHNHVRACIRYPPIVPFLVSLSITFRTALWRVRWGAGRQWYSWHRALRCFNNMDIHIPYYLSPYRAKLID